MASNSGRRSTIAVEIAGELDVVADATHIRVASVSEQRHPHLEGGETPREVDTGEAEIVTPLDEVTILMDVGRVDAEALG